MEQLGEPVGVELVGLVDVAHQELGLGGVGQEGEAACGFDLVGDPIPIADTLQGDRGAWRKVLQEDLDSPWLVVDPLLGHEAASRIQDRELRIVLVGVTSDPIMGHGCTSFTCALSRHECSGRCSAFI
jgi:hypothetical protein